MRMDLKKLIMLLIAITAVDAYFTWKNDNVSCVIADHHWLTIIGVTIISTVISASITKYRMTKNG